MHIDENDIPKDQANTFYTYDSGSTQDNLLQAWSEHTNDRDSDQKDIDPKDKCIMLHVQAHQKNRLNKT